MRSSETCPKCRSRKLFVVEQVSYAHPNPRLPQKVTLPAATAVWKDESDWLAPFVGGIPQLQTAGYFEAWICAHCGFTELYTKDLAEIERLIQNKAAGIRVVESDAPSSGGPYRGAGGPGGTGGQTGG